MFRVFQVIQVIRGKSPIWRMAQKTAKKIKIFLSDFQRVIKKCEIFLPKYFAGIEKSCNFALAFQG